MSKGFKLNRKGVAELLKSPEMAEVIRDASDGVLQRAGGSSAGYSMNVQIHNRAVGRVYPYNATGQRDNNENNTLLKALK